MAKKKETKPERKIYKDFTLDEYDVLTMDLQCEGAMHERGAIIDELQRTRIQLLNLSHVADNPGRDDQFGKYASALTMAINIINGMPNFEDRCGCRECGAI